MSEPPDAVAAGVASALKSLRTRAGLREDRLSGTELALDTLMGLTSVRELVAAGETPERAIVRAVRAAAGTLDPTPSIVTDASLGLELSADLIDDAELYARDLGQRRGALLRNWDRLHQLRSVPSPKPPSARALRLEVEAGALTALAVALTSPGGSPAGHARPAPQRVPDEDDAQAGDQEVRPAPGSAELLAFGAELRKALLTRELTALDVAGRIAIPESVITGWLDGRDLPSEQDAKSLDDCLTARGAILNLALELRVKQTRTGGAGPGTVLPPAGPASTLSEVFEQVAHALRGCLTKTDDGTPIGWPHDLRQLSAKPTAVSTAYGLKIMLLLEGDLAPDLVPVVEKLRTMSSEGGYMTREQVNPRPEVTASVIDVLHRVDGTADFADQVAVMLSDLSDFEKSRPFILTTMLETSLRLRGAGDLTRLLADSLLKARRPYGNRLLWPEKTEALLIDPDPSLAHTARAVRALSRLQLASPGEQLRDAVEQGVSWLLEENQFQNASDVVDRSVGGRLESVYTRHFTAAWVVKALVSAGVPATHPTVSNAVSQVWDSYADTAALWKWGNGDLPIWMTFDAVDALRLVSLAVPARPGR
ncbi:MAG TPA: hypothetical protein VI365_28425 [Trebonia sp.]